MNAGKEQIKSAQYTNYSDDKGMPTGGIFNAKGIDIIWQNGALKLEDGTFAKPNGAFVETVIYAAIQRIEYHQAGRFKCRENALALTKLEEALHWLHARTEGRENRGVEGSHAV